jgi:hypothetical protein
LDERWPVSAGGFLKARLQHFLERCWFVRVVAVHELFVVVCCSTEQELGKVVQQMVRGGGAG